MRIGVADTPRLRAGDHVDVYVTFDPGQVSADSDPTRTVAEAVPVLALDRDDATGDAATTGVTLMVGVDEAPRLAYAAANGVLALALVPPEETDDPTPARGARTLPSR
jgi:Flp pilus assembly protein CpaB